MRTVTTATAQKPKKYEFNRGKENCFREQPSASREPVVRRYSYLQKSESLEVPEEVQVPNRVVNEEEEAEVEERNYFVGTIQEDKNASVITELPDSKRTSWLNPEAAEFVPVFTSRFVTDPDPVTSSLPTTGCEKSLDGVDSPSPVEIILVIAHEPGQLDSWIPGWKMLRTLWLLKVVKEWNRQKRQKSGLRMLHTKV